MARVARYAVVGLVMLLAFPAWGADRAGFYAGLRLVGSVANLNDEQTTGFSGPLITNNGSDLVGGGGGVFGYRWGRFPFRTEVEVAHRVRFDWDARDGGPPVIGYENNLDSTNVLFNLLLEYRNLSNFTPFFGGTVGWSRNNSEMRRTVVSTNTSISQSTVVNNVAWGVMMGVDWGFGENWSAEFAYRYINLGEVDSGVFPAGDQLKADEYVSHDILISVLYKW